MLIGQPLELLEKYRPPLTKAADFESFWRGTLATFVADDPQPLLTPIDTPITEIEIFDVSIPGYNQDLVKGWFITPKKLTTPRPVVIV